MSQENEDLYLDNQELDEEDVEELDDEVEPLDDDSGEEDPPKRGGNLAKALQEERRQRKEYEKRVKNLEDKLTRSEAVIERSQPQPQEQQFDVDGFREQFYRSPEVVLQNIIAQQHQQTYQTLGPLLAEQAVNQIAGNEELSPYLAHPEVKQTLVAYAQGQYTNGAQPTPQAMLDAAQMVRDLVDVGRRMADGAAPVKGSNKTKLGTTVNRNTGSVKVSDEELYQRKIKEGRKNPKALDQWASSQEGRQVVERLIKSGHAF